MRSHLLSFPSPSFFTPDARSFLTPVDYICVCTPAASRFRIYYHYLPSAPPLHFAESSFSRGNCHPCESTKYSTTPTPFRPTFLPTTGAFPVRPLEPPSRSPPSIRRVRRGGPNETWQKIKKPLTHPHPLPRGKHTTLVHELNIRSVFFFLPLPLHPLAPPLRRSNAIQERRCALFEYLETLFDVSHPVFHLERGKRDSSGNNFSVLSLARVPREEAKLIISTAHFGSYLIEAFHFPRIKLVYSQSRGRAGASCLN